jgi:low temperature requirement protein LtrA
MSSAEPRSGPVPATEEVLQVTSLELFFDLVFVFAVTQLTGVLVHDLSPLGLFRVLVMFGVLWWMYGGYAWLTNTMAPTRWSRRILLLVGMAGFMVVALATPRAFEGDGVAWGLGYLVVVLVHAGLYVQSIAISCAYCRSTCSPRGSSWRPACCVVRSCTCSGPPPS